MKLGRPQLLLVLAVLAAWVGAPRPVFAQKALRYAEDLAPRIVNPLFTTTMSEVRMNELIFDSLFRENYELKMVPSLVSEYRFKKGGTSMDITLRKGLKWQDGTPVTANDVVFTIKAYQNKKTMSPNARQVAFIKEATAKSDTELTIFFFKEEDNPERKLDFLILPAHKFQGKDFVQRTDPFKNRPIGTGPFKLTNYGDDNSITLERNGTYPKQISVPSIVMKEIPDKSQQANLLKYESLDLVVKVLPKDVAALEENRKIELYPYQTNSWWYVGFNFKNPVLADARVRRAIASSINIEELLKPIGTGDILSGPFVKSSPYYNHDADVKPAQLNLVQAQELFKAAGYVRKGDFWEKGGKPLVLRLSVPRSLDSAREVVLNLQTQLAKGGIKVEPSWENDASWKQKIWRNMDFDLVLSVWTFDAKEDIYDQFFSKGSKNFISYNNPQVDQLLSKGMQVVDPQQRKQIYRQVHKTLNQDLPYIFLWSLDSYSAISTRIENVTIHPFAYFSFIQDWVMK
jgi:peptide/nickel transport system substrate-binding protein